MSVEKGIIEFLLLDQFFTKTFQLLLDFPSNNILHDIVLKIYMIVCELEEDALCEILLDSNLLDKIGEIWKLFCDNNSEPLSSSQNLISQFSKRISTSQIIIKDNNGNRNRHYCFFGHIGILTNLLSEIATDMEGINEIVAVSNLWKTYVEPNIDSYNLMMMDVTTTSNIS
jgi:hypothetical protein